MAPQARKVIIIAGPNGAGKTTFAREFLPQEAACPVFVNADLIAAGLAPFAPEAAAVQAGRLMLAEMERHFLAGRSFAFETTLSGRAYLRHIARWRAALWRVELIFCNSTTPMKPWRGWRSGCGKAGTIFPKPSFVAAFVPDWKISASTTPQQWMRGHCMTMRAKRRYYLIGANDEP